MDLNRSIIPLSLAFLACLLAGLESLPMPMALALVPLLMALLLIIATSRLEPKARVLLAALLLAASLAGFLRGVTDTNAYRHALALQGAYEGRLIVEESRGEDAYLARLEEGQGIRIIFYSKEPLRPGQILAAKGFLELPAEALNEGGFSYREYLRNQGIPFLLEADSLEPEGHRTTPASLIAAYREFYLERMEGILGEDVRYLKSTFLGDYDSLTEEDRESWKKLGITHLQAVSGAQVGALLDLILLLYLLTPGKGGAKPLILLSLLLFYGLLTDSPSVWRAIVFFLVTILFERLRLEKSELTALLLSAVLLLLAEPRFLFQISFQLSYVIALGVILYKETTMKAGGALRRTLAAGLVSMLFSLPLLLLYFQQLSLLTLLATPLIAPLVQLVILLAAIYLYAPFLTQWLIPLNAFLAGSIGAMNWGVAQLNRIPPYFLEGRPWPLALILLYYMLLIFFAGEERRKRWQKPMLKARVPVLLLLLAAVFVANRLPSGDLEAIFINVGQGDSILLITPNPRKAILIDGGRAYGDLDMGEREVIPYLRRRGIRKLDLLISTHSDNDHMGGLESVLEVLEPAAIAIPPLEYDGEGDYAGWKEQWGGRLLELERGSRFTVGEVSFEILEPADGLTNPDKNAAGIVLEVRYKGTSLLLTADCELEALERLAEEGRSYDVIKAPHHGSEKSWRPGIYAVLRAGAVIFSVGENRYGHPSALLLEDLLRDGIPAFRTDRAGEIEVRMTGEEIYVEGRKL